MKRSTLAALSALTLGACADRNAVTAPTAPDLSRGDTAGNPTGDVYVQTNAAAGNEVVVFHRSANGKLQPPKLVATGGRGTGRPRLGSQGSMILSDDGSRLFVANVGSSDVSVFDVTSGGLTLVDRVPSGGTTPYSLTLHGNLLYVLNHGISAAAGSPANITAFTVGAGGKLTALANSTRPLSTAEPDPAEVRFSPRGDALVVTEKATNQIDTYAVGAGGYASGPVVHPASGETPFGLDFTTSGTLIVTEAFGGTPGQAAVSSYSLAGGFQLLSGTVRDTQAEVCWAVVSQDNKYAFITNFGSGTISSYRVAADGHLTLLQAVAGQTSPSFGPRDEDLSAGGQYLYVLEIGATDHAAQAVNAFKVGGDGGLTKIGAYPLPQFYPAVAGLAAQ